MRLLVDSLRARDDLLDDVVGEAARGEVLVDLPLALALVHREPAGHRPADDLARALRLGVGVGLAEHDVDRLARDALREQLAHDRPLALGPEPCALVDPVASEGLVVDVALRPECVDGLVLGVVIEVLRAKVSLDLGDASRTRPKETDRGVIRIAFWWRVARGPASSPHPGRRPAWRPTSRGPCPRPPRRHPRDRGR